MNSVVRRVVTSLGILWTYVRPVFAIKFLDNLNQDLASLGFKLKICEMGQWKNQMLKC